MNRVPRAARDPAIRRRSLAHRQASGSHFPDGDALQLLRSLAAAMPTVKAAIKGQVRHAFCKGLTATAPASRYLHLFG